MDGAHTHHHGPTGPGIGTAILAVFGLALALGIAHAVAAILPALLIGLAAVAGLILAALSVCAVLAWRHRRAAWHQPTPGHVLPPPGHVPLAGDREVMRLRQAINEVHAQLAATRALDPGHRPGAHQHLHFHGLDPAQVAAILAACRREAGEGE
jgi:hypothetical protein